MIRKTFKSFIKEAAGSKSFASAIKKSHEARQSDIIKAARWMKKTGKSVEDAIKEFDLFSGDAQDIKDLAEAVINESEEIMWQERSGDWVVNIVQTKLRSQLESEFAKEIKSGNVEVILGKGMISGVLFRTKDKGLAEKIFKSSGLKESVITEASGVLRADPENIVFLTLIRKIQGFEWDGGATKEMVGATLTVGGKTKMGQDVYFIFIPPEIKANTLITGWYFEGVEALTGNSKQEKFDKSGKAISDYLMSLNTMKDIEFARGWAAIDRKLIDNNINELHKAFTYYEKKLKNDATQFTVLNRLAKK